MAISLIVDLDDPRVGSVRVPQTPMENVARKVEAMAAALPRTSASAASPLTLTLSPKGGEGTWRASWAFFTLSPAGRG